MATLFIVATPIGNLEDITLRALNVLKSVDAILCEDTRTTKKLLDRHGISAKTISYHQHSKLSKVEEIISLLKEGKSLALVSDAGTPGISDPGSELVRHVRNECAAEVSSGEIEIEAVPGASALTSALSIAGVPIHEFTFLGFLPHKKGRETLFKEIAASERTMVFYESTHRIMKTLESLAKHGERSTEKGEMKSGKKITVCRELTKIYEQVVCGTADEVFNYFNENPDKVRGEFVVIVSNK